MANQQEFQKELTDLLAKYDVSLAVQDVPASKKIVVVPNKKEEIGVPPKGTGHAPVIEDEKGETSK